MSIILNIAKKVQIHRVEKKELVAPLPSYPSRVPTSPPWRTNVDEEFKKFSRPIPVWKPNGENLQASTLRKNPRLEKSFHPEEKATSIQAKNAALPPEIRKPTGILKTPGRQNTIATGVTPPSGKESFQATRASGKVGFENKKTTKKKSSQNSLSRKRKLGNEYKDDLGAKRLRNNKTW